jgi:hypothetical protein
MSSFFNSFKRKTASGKEKDFNNKSSNAAGDKAARASFKTPSVPAPPPPASRIDAVKKEEASSSQPAPAPPAEPQRGGKSELEYNDNDLKTQLVTALNEIESLRIQRDSLKDELEAASKEVDDLKEQLLSSMNETKKALKTQLAQAREEIVNLKAVIDGKPEIPNTGVSRRESFTGGTGIIKASKPKKKGIDWSAQITQVKEFTDEPAEDDGIAPPKSTLGIFKDKENADKQLTFEEKKKLSTGRWESQVANLTIISDLDGTLLPGPKKVNNILVHPKLGDGAVYAPLINLLEKGASIVGVTGSRITMHKPRFWDELPLNARIEGRVLLFCETGMVLYRSDNKGNPVEDESYGPFPGNTKRFLRQQTIDSIVAAARAGLKQWFTDLKENPSLLDEKHWLHGKCERWCKEDAPVTNDPDMTPRIELRGPSDTQVVGVMIAGIPIQYGDKYLASNFKPFSDEISGQPTGRLCYDCVVPGLSKHLVLKYLLRTGALARGSAIALADSPHGNDVGLTEYHTDGMPFVSVCDKIKKVPKHLLDCHVGGNEIGSGAFLQQLVDRWEKAGGFHRTEANQDPLSLHTVQDLAEAAAKVVADHEAAEAAGKGTST